MQSIAHECSYCRCTDFDRQEHHYQLADGRWFHECEWYCTDCGEVYGVYDITDPKASETPFCATCGAVDVSIRKRHILHTDFIVETKTIACNNCGAVVVESGVE